jgi:hypothetical protein
VKLLEPEARDRVHDEVKEPFGLSDCCERLRRGLAGSVESRPDERELALRRAGARLHVVGSIMTQPGGASSPRCLRIFAVSFVRSTSLSFALRSWPFIAPSGSFRNCATFLGSLESFAMKRAAFFDMNFSFGES